jgi:acyl-coenzyme A synthetase/AMP-(fatty) acid ligase
VSRTLPRFKAPRELVLLVEDVPRTYSGKIRHTALA